MHGLLLPFPFPRYFVDLLTRFGAAHGFSHILGALRASVLADEASAATTSAGDSDPSAADNNNNNNSGGDDAVVAADQVELSVAATAASRPSQTLSEILPDKALPEPEAPKPAADATPATDADADTGAGADAGAGAAAAADADADAAKPAADAAEDDADKAQEGGSKDDTTRPAEAVDVGGGAGGGAGAGAGTGAGDDAGAGESKDKDAEEAAGEEGDDGREDALDVVLDEPMPPALAPPTELPLRMVELGYITEALSFIASLDAFTARPFARELYTSAMYWALRAVLATDEAGLRVLSKKIVSDLTKGCGVLLGRVCSPTTVSRVRHQFRLALALRCLSSVVLERQLDGMQYLEDEADLLFSKSRSGWLTTKRLTEWIAANRVLERIFARGTHYELVRRAGSLVLFLVRKECFTADTLALVWGARHVSDEATVLNSVVAAAVRGMGAAQLEHVGKLITEVPPADVSSPLLGFVRSYCR